MQPPSILSEANAPSVIKAGEEISLFSKKWKMNSLKAEDQANRLEKSKRYPQKSP